MAAKKQAAASKGRRYTADEKAEVLAFAAALGRGGQGAAAKKFKISPLTISSWRKAAGGGAGPAKAANSQDLESQTAAYLSKQGFSYEIWRSQSTGSTKRELSKSLEALALFGGGDYKVVRVERGEPVIEVKLSKLLELTKTKP